MGGSAVNSAGEFLRRANAAGVLRLADGKKVGNGFPRVGADLIR